MFRFFILTILAGAIICGCEEIEDPSQEAQPPMITVDFDAQSSKDTTKYRFDTLSSRLRYLQLELDTFRQGEGNPEDSMVFWQEWIELEPVVDSLEDVNTLFQNGRIRIDSLIGIGGNFVENYQDTINSAFNFPLNPNVDSSAFVVYFHHFVDTLVFSYDRQISAGIDRINVVATHITARNSNENVVISRHTCLNENCTSGEIVYKIYF